MIKLQKARELAQSRKVLLDTAKEYDFAYVFSYSKGFNLTLSEEIVVFKESGEVYSRNQVKDEDLGNIITTISF
ncbi:hypothetical protein [Pseudobutyrivibrio ruminis]|uniref:hypothetical protein n=1 Tax=Pseudobutyrivibrio ruminis TaxID=46206 RepID=UPI00051B0272|nr:hypothetical protein [Pseudobutyrivibrio ruminis]